MGIPRLTAFMNDKFKGWKPVKDLDRIIIDGQSVCLILYRESCQWALGGEYNRFQAKVEEMFARFKDPIVLFDGVVSDQDQAKVTKKISYAEKLKKIQSGREWDTEETLLPLFIVPTFIDVLKRLKITFFVTDGRADREMAALANHYKCPVLSGDSDFFIFNLEHGYISFERFIRQRKSLFYIEDFMKQFTLKEYQLCLLIPAYFGNDYAEGKRSDFEVFLKNLARNKSCEMYFKNSGNFFSVSRQNYETVTKFYCNVPLPTVEDENETVICDLPKWFCESYKAGNFIKPLLYSKINKKSRLPQIIETVAYESAWMVSRTIRQHLYHIMGIEEVTEVCRKKSEAQQIEENVLALPLNPPVSIHDEVFVVNDKKRLSDMVLQILQCQKRSPEILTLPDNFQLPLAATVYWYRALEEALPALEERLPLIVSLLLSFMVCLNNLVLEKSFSVQPSTEPSHLKILHAFAQWQCVYFDAMALNSLAREPFPTTSPGYLYSGNVAMHYASLSMQDLTKSLKEIFCHPDSEDRKLFHQLLHVATGSDEVIDTA